MKSLFRSGRRRWRGALRGTVKRRKRGRKRGKRGRKRRKKGVVKRRQEVGKRRKRGRITGCK